MTLILLLVLTLQAGPTAQIDTAVEDGIRSGVYPGAVVVVGTGDSVLLAKGYGHFSWSSDSRAPDPDSTLYDLASLTKVVAATPAIMRLADMGRVDLDAPVQNYLPEFKGDGKESVTVMSLLEHRSGLRAFLPLNDQSETAAEARRLVLEEELRWTPGSRVIYSDLNAMLVGWVVESASGESLDSYAAEEVFGPIGMKRTMFKPPRSLRSSMAPVGLWHGHVIAGELHDQNAVRLGGVSGHAGLYSTGRDLALYAQVFLNLGRTKSGVQLFAPETVLQFTRRGPGNRALGWEVRDTTDVANAGRLLSDSAYGHGGYTGTSIWIDPSRDLFVILLTNRVFAPRTGRSITRLKAIRARIADAAVALRDEACASVVIGARTKTRCL